MKRQWKISIAIFATVCVAAPGAAQPFFDEPDLSHGPFPPNAVVFHHEVSVGTGWFEIVGDLLLRHDVSGYTMHFMENSTMVSAGYKYRLKRPFSVGATYVFSSSNGQASYGNGEINALGSRRQHTLALEGDVRWLTRRVVTIYSTLGAGLSFAKSSVKPYDQTRPVEKILRTVPNLHLSFIGVKIGYRRLGVWVEYGRGYKGVISGGLYTRF